MWCSINTHTHTLSLSLADGTPEGVDFPRQSQMVNVPAGSNIRQDFPLTIPINDDMINEATEIFLALVEASENTSNNAEAPVILYPNGSLAIGRIVDDDG